MPQAQQVRKVWDRGKLERTWGLFDPQTGRLSNAKMAFWSRLQEGVDKRFNADALLCGGSGLSQGQLQLCSHRQPSRAKWDGATSPMETGSFDKIVSPGVNGRLVPAPLARHQDSRTMSGSALYVNAGGVQVLQKPWELRLGDSAADTSVPVPKAN